MKFRDLFRWGKTSIQEAPGGSSGGGGKGKGPQINPGNLKNFVVKAVGLIGGGGSGRADFTAPEHDLSEIKTAADSDSYIKMALMKYSYLIYKAGYKLKGENDQATEYLRTRFRIMSFCTGKPMDILFQEIGDDLVKYSNAFLVKSRIDNTQSLGGVQAKGVLDAKPVGGYFRVDPTTMQIKRDKSGTVTGYQQQADSVTKKYKPTDVVHFYIDRQAGDAFGTPRISAALEDVKLLRKIEGNIVSLIYRYAIPIYQWIIGLPEVGFMATDKEIQDAKMEAEKMAADGMIITNERTKIQAIGVEGEALDATNYLNYFEKRVFSALGVSESQMGRGGAKQDADSMEAQIHMVVKYIQKIISIFIENMMLNELLMEGGYQPLSNEQDMVHFVFDEINIETKIKLENHEMLKFQSNVVTFEEVRQNLGLKADADQGMLYANMIDHKNALEQIQAKADGAAQVAAGRASGVAGNGTTKTAKPNGSVKSNNQPTNQHGTGSAKVKEFSEGAEDIQVAKKAQKNVHAHKKSYQAVYKKWEDMRNDIIEHRESADIIIPVVKDSIVKAIQNETHMASQDGIIKALRDNKTQGASHLEKISMSIFDDLIDQTVKNLMQDVQKRTKGIDKHEVPVVFESLEYRLRFLIEYVIPKSYWYSYVRTCAQFGVDKVYIDFKGSDDADEHPHEISTKNFAWDDIPAYHAFCDCEVVLKKAGDKAA